MNEQTCASVTYHLDTHLPTQLSVTHLLLIYSSVCPSPQCIHSSSSPCTHPPSTHQYIYQTTPPSVYPSIPLSMIPLIPLPAYSPAQLLFILLHKHSSIHAPSTHLLICLSISPIHLSIHKSIHTPPPQPLTYLPALLPNIFSAFDLVLSTVSTGMCKPPSRLPTSLLPT